MASPISQLTYHRTITLNSQFRKIPIPTTSFENQVVIITGSNTGIGLESARHIIRLGAAKVILGVRNIKAGNDAAASIIESTRVNENVVEVWPLDMADNESIKAFSGRVEKMERLDAVLLNAGVAANSFRRTKSGEEMTMGVNTIGTVLLGLLVMPKLRSSAAKTGLRARLCVTGSESYLFAKLDEAKRDDGRELMELLRDEKVFEEGIFDRYMTSKLLLLYATREMAARSPLSTDSNVLITTVTPGLCWSGLYRDLPWFAAPFYYIIMSIFARTSEVGGRLLVDALRPDLELDKHDAFLMDGAAMVRLGPSVESNQAKVVAHWFNRELFGSLESIVPGCTKVLK